MEAQLNPGNRIGWDVVKAALVAYQKANPLNDSAQVGDLNRMPGKFVVPSGDDKWPAATWGLKIGFILYDIKRRGTYKDNRQELLYMGVQYKAGV